MDQLALLRRIVDALGALPVRGVVTTGHAIDPEELPSHPQVQVLRSAPHRAVLEHASAVVMHGGHGTVIKALAADAPLLVLPMGRDQLDNATRVTERGAGLRLEPDAGADAMPRRCAGCSTSRASARPPRGWAHGCGPRRRTTRPRPNSKDWSATNARPSPRRLTYSGHEARRRWRRA
jgi:hypothetical protein